MILTCQSYHMSPAIHLQSTPPFHPCAWPPKDDMARPPPDTRHGAGLACLLHCVVRAHCPFLQCSLLPSWCASAQLELTADPSRGDGVMAANPLPASSYLRHASPLGFARANLVKLPHIGPGKPPISASRSSTHNKRFNLSLSHCIQPAYASLALNHGHSKPITSLARATTRFGRYYALSVIRVSSTTTARIAHAKAQS
jgi:hypothetical protein